ncbi:vacuolar protein sorting-associated protein 54, partial [Aphelenchoides avenae]
FTQNLSSVIADPRRSKSETTTFFTRHWGEQFVPKTSVAAAPTLPRISSDHFRQYLSTTAKKHRQYLKAKRALRKALARHAEENAVDPDEVPSVFTSATFALNKPETFEAVFLEPPTGDQDKLMSDSERRRASTASPQGTSASLSRPDSCTSLVSTPSLNAQLPIEAANRRWFRPYHALHNRLEYYHDTVGTLLNHQLETKGETFWKTVNSYGALQMELVDAKRKTQTVRANLRVLDEKFYERSQKIIRLQRARENRERLLHRLQDIACLRDAQTTVQMLLNQNDFPKALECIETAEEVLNSDLKGVTCFRHLSSQLQELHKFIGRMLNEEFITLIQKEFGKP